MTARLTVREVDVLKALGEGLRNGQIATRLGISESTVSNTLSGAYAKLGVNKRQDAVEEFRRNWSETGRKTGMAGAVSVTSHAVVDVDQLADPENGAAPAEPSLYRWYHRLGDWRTPPRSAVFRIWVVLGWFMIGCCILLIGLAVGQMLFGGTDGFAPAANPS